MKDLLLAVNMTGFVLNAWLFAWMLRLRLWPSAFFHASGMLITVPYIFLCWRFLWAQ